MKDSIAIAGSILVDKINEISAYPNAGELTKIRSVKKAVGGCVPNVAIDLKKMATDLIVKAVGKIGADEEGEFVKNAFICSTLRIPQQGFQGRPSAAPSCGHAAARMFPSRS